MTRNVIRYNVVTMRKFFNEGRWVSEAWRKEHPEEFTKMSKDLPRELKRLLSEKTLFILCQFVRAPCVCGLWARHLHMAFG